MQNIQSYPFVWQVGGPYPLGVDPVWHGSRTELPFLNSVKMKMSIVLGVIQMNLGILMSLFNQRYFRDNLSTMCDKPYPVVISCHDNPTSGRLANQPWLQFQKPSVRPFTPGQ